MPKSLVSAKQDIPLPSLPPYTHTHTHVQPPPASRLLALLVLSTSSQWDWRCCVLCIKCCLRSFIACHKTAYQVKLKVSFGCLPTFPVRAGPVPLAALLPTSPNHSHIFPNSRKDNARIIQTLHCHFTVNWYLFMYVRVLACLCCRKQTSLRLG